MSLPTRHELLAGTAPRYVTANKKQKQIILDEFAAATGYHRKYAISLLKNYEPKKTLPRRKPRQMMRLSRRSPLRRSRFR